MGRSSLWHGTVNRLGAGWYEPGRQVASTNCPTRATKYWLRVKLSSCCTAWRAWWASSSAKASDGAGSHLRSDRGGGRFWPAAADLLDQLQRQCVQAPAVAGHLQRIGGIAQQRVAEQVGGSAPTVDMPAL